MYVMETQNVIYLLTVAVIQKIWPKNQTG